MTGLAEDLFGRYRRIMRWTLLGVTVVASALLWLQFQQRELAAWLALEDRVRDHALALDYLLRDVADQVQVLRLRALGYLRDHPEAPAPSDLYQALLAHPPRDGLLTLDQLPPGVPAEAVGNLIAEAREPGPAFRLEAELALSLNGSFEALTKVLPGVRAAYYSSHQRLVNLYPWAPSSGDERLAVFRALDGRWTDPWQMLKDVSGASGPFWADRGPPPLSGAAAAPGAAVMSSGGPTLVCGAPVSFNGVHRGTVAIDLTLEELSAALRHLALPFGRLLVVNERGELLASGDQEALAGIRTLAELLPPPWNDQSAPLLRLARYTMIRRGGLLLAAEPLAHAPFSLVFVADHSRLMLSVASETVLSVSALVAALALVLGAASFFTRRQLIVPSQQLVDYIGQEARGEAMGIPSVPSPWRPWFETIHTAFNAHTQLVSIRRELDVARTMQQAILPTRFPNRPDLQLFGCMKPAKDIGGDFYDFFWLDEHRLGVVVADVSGKGVPAALFMAVSRTLLRAVMAEGGSPGRALAGTNELLVRENEASMFVTVFYGVIDAASGTLTYANGGHPSPLLLDPAGPVIELEGTGGVALGLVDGLAYQERTQALPVGSSLLLYTDGVTEAFAPDGREFTEEGLIRALGRHQGGSAEQTVSRVLQAVEQFAAGAAQADDLTCLAVRWLGPAPLVPAQGPARRQGSASPPRTPTA